VLAGLVAACVGASACGSSSSDGGGGDAFHVGAMADLTGPSAQVGRSMMDGINAAVKGINARGGVAGRKIELTTRDDQNAQATGVSGFRALMGQKDILGVIGVNSSFVDSTVVPLVKQSKTPLVSTSFPPELLNPPQAGVYNVVAEPEAQGAAQVDFLSQLVRSGDLPKNARVAILRFDSPLSQGWAAGAKNQAKQDGLDVVTEQSYALGATDVSSQSIRLAGAHPDAILLFVLPSEASMVVNAFNNAGVKSDVPMVGYFADSSKEFLEQMKGRPYYGLADYNFTSDSPLAAQIEADARRAGVNPNGGLFLEGYALGLMTRAALQQCGKDCDRASFAKALDGLSTDLDGFAFGSFAFSPDDHVGISDVAFVKLEGDKVVQAGDPVSLAR